MNNNIINNIDLLNGLNINPIPLEFNQGMTTTKWLLSMQATLTSISVAVNAWYDNIYTDLENGGVLYQTIKDHLDGEFTQQLANINSALTIISDTLNMSPTVSLTLAPTKLLYQVGENINSVVINFNIIKGNNELLKAEIYKNGTLLTTINNITNGINSFTDGNIINFDTSYYVKIYDTQNVIVSNTVKYQFTNNVYCGLASNADIINNAFITGLPATQLLKGDIIFTPSPNNQKILIAYPSSYGLLASIIDGNNFEILNSFIVTTLSITIGTNIPILYNIYTSDNLLIGTNVKLNFKF